MSPVSPPLSDVLRAWVDAGWLRALDEAFADFVAAPAAGQATFDPLVPLVRLAAAWVSHQAGRGQTGLDLAATLTDPARTLDLPPQDGPNSSPNRARQEAQGPAMPLPGDLLAGVTLTSWVAALRAHPAVGEGPGSTPLVLTQQRLQLRRHWQSEQSIEQALGQRLQQPLAVDNAALRQALDALATGVPAGGPADERLRVALGGFGGDADDYDDLRASLIHEVVRRRRGLPILLSAVWLEVAARAGIPA